MGRSYFVLATSGRAQHVEFHLNIPCWTFFPRLDAPVAPRMFMPLRVLCKAVFGLRRRFVGPAAGRSGRGENSPEGCSGRSLRAGFAPQQHSLGSSPGKSAGQPTTPSAPCWFATSARAIVRRQRGEDVAVIAICSSLGDKPNLRRVWSGSCIQLADRLDELQDSGVGGRLGEQGGYS